MDTQKWSANALRYIVTILLACTSSAQAAGPIPNDAPLELRGVTVDELPDCQALKALELRPGILPLCQSTSLQSYAEWRFLGRTSQVLISRNSQRVLTSIIVEGFDFETAMTAFTDKFGAPSIERSVVQNGFGARYGQLIAIWQRGQKRLEIRRHGTSPNAPIIMLTGAAERQQSNSQARQNRLEM